jgi:hypothetical protein
MESQNKEPTMLILIAALSFHLNFGSHSTKPEPAVTCGIHVVSYRFVGEAGVIFNYHGRDYTVPKGGTIELIANGREQSYRANGHDLPLNVWSRDEFGAVTVPLPAKAVAETMRETAESAR